MAITSQTEFTGLDLIDNGDERLEDSRIKISQNFFLIDQLFQSDVFDNRYYTKTQIDLALSSLTDAAFVVETIDELSAIPSGYSVVVVKDLDRGGTFIWSATGTANGGTVFAGVNGYWNRQYSGSVNVKWFGAKGDGVTDDTPYFNLVKDMDFYIEKGSYIVTTGYTYSKNVEFKGGVLQSNSGITSTFLNPIIVDGTKKCFNLGTSDYVVLKNDYGYLEWFGAETGNGAFDNALIIEKAQFCIKKIKLLPKDYWVQTTIDISQNRFEIEGAGKRWGVDNKATRIINTSYTADTFKLRPLTFTHNNPNTFLTEVKISNLDILRTNLTPPSLGNEINGGAGIRLEYTLFTYVNNVRVSEHTTGFLLSGTVRTYLTNCESFRSPAVNLSTALNDKFFGIWLNGNVDIGMAGGNASSYINGCTAGTGGSPTLVESVGLYLPDKFVDTFITQFEASDISIGILADGLGEDTRTGHIDLHILNCIIDVFKVAGIKIANTAASGAIDISNCYCAPRGSEPSTVACYWIQNSYSMVSLTNNQAVCAPNSVTLGIYANTCTNIISRSNMVQESGRPIGFTNCQSCSSEDNIVNNSTVATQSALRIAKTYRSYFRPILTGAAGKFPEGVNIVDSSSVLNEINTTGIDESKILSGKRCSINGIYPSQTHGQIINNNIITGLYA